MSEACQVSGTQGLYILKHWVNLIMAGKHAKMEPCQSISNLYMKRFGGDNTFLAGGWEDSLSPAYSIYKKHYFCLK